jgi:hypothetical protein
MIWPFEIDWRGALQDRSRPVPGASPHIITVSAREEWNKTPHLFLEAGGLYRFKVVGEPDDWGRW